MKKRFLALGLAAGLTALMTACGDETTNTDIIKASSADNVDSLPKCDNSYEGMLATIPSKGQILVCNKGSWQNVAKTIQTSTDSSGNSTNESGCTAKTLEDKSGVTIICSGEKIATLKNGEKGPEGNPGKQGGQGDQGDPGSNGTGSSGSDLKLDETDCSVTYMGYDVTLYKCGDEEYLENLNGYEANLKTWNGLNVETTIMAKNGSSNYVDEIFTQSLISSTLSDTKGSFSWRGEDNELTSVKLTADELKKNFAIRGKAKLSVEKEATTFDYFPVEPMVGVYMQFVKNVNVHSWGGFCLTYEAKQKMELIAIDFVKKELVRVPLNASSKATTVNILPSDFKADSADVKVAKLLQDPSAIIIKAVGSLEEGEYENEFAIYEFGAYGRCSGITIADIETKAKTVKKGTFTDPRDLKEYNTVTIGDQTWFAENLDYDYKVHVDVADDVADTAFECGTEHPCVEGLVYNYSDEDKALYGGRLYTWAAAIDSAKLARAETPLTCGNEKTCTLPETVQGICPTGWHVPSADEYTTLRDYATDFVGFDNNTLRAMSLLDESAGGKNWLGFSYTLGGHLNNTGSLVSNGVFFAGWTSKEFSSTQAWTVYFRKNAVDVPSSSNNKNYSRAIRCVQDQAKE